MSNAVRLRELLHYDPDTGIFRHRTGRLVGKIAGYTQPRGYRYIWFGGRSCRTGRLAWLYMTGAWPAQIVDHRNRDRTDDRWENLRLATKSQNNANARLCRPNIAGLKGVCPSGRDAKPWRAAINHDGKRRHLGHFSTREEAHAAYIDAARRLFGEFACQG
jgi:hypothetical protein